MNIAYQSTAITAIVLLAVALFWPKNEYDIDRSLVQLLCMGGGLSMLLWALLFYVLSKLGGG